MYLYHHNTPTNTLILSPSWLVKSPIKSPYHGQRGAPLEIPTASAAPSKADRFGARPDLGSAGNPCVIMTCHLQ